MQQNFQFLCGFFDNKKFIYATKFSQHPWHYFKKLHSIITEHDSLLAKLERVVANLKEIQSIEILLDDEQVKHYYDNGKFIFKNTELKTFKTLCNISPENQNKRHLEKTKKVIFRPGETNPLWFLAEFEKCRDMETDRDKIWRIRHFVDDQHKAKFSKLRFTGDWATARRVFIETYSLQFIENKKKAINIDFNKEPDLRSFVTEKLLSLDAYTTLPFVNQMEIVLNELPDEISYFFMVNEIFDCDKEDIFDFCDSVQDICEMYKEDHITQRIQQPSHHVEELSTGDQDESVFSTPTSQEQSSRSSRGRAKRGSVSRGRGRGRPRKKKMTSIPEEETCSQTSDYTFLDEMSNTSHSTWSSHTGSSSGWSSLN